MVLLYHRRENLQPLGFRLYHNAPILRLKRINLMMHERFIKVKHPDYIVVVECICNNSWHNIKRLFVFYNFPITIFSTIFADNNPHCLKLRDMSLECSELYASLLRHFTGRNRRVE